MTAINAVTDLATDGEIAVITINAPPVNALSANVRDGLAACIDKAIDDDAVRGIVLICDGRTFIAGADISEFGTPPKPPIVQDVIAKIDNASKPVVAAIHGTALGGGLETALACHYRVAVASARCGLPEVTLGLLPGAGGTQRLPRLVGVEKALRMVTSGEHVPAKACLEMGLVDEIVPEDGLRNGAIAFARKILSEDRPLRRVRDNDDKLVPARPDIFANFRKENARRFRGFMAPEYNIRCIEAAVNKPFAEGISVERDLFEELLAGSQSAAQRYLFFAERDLWKIPDIPKDTPILPVAKVGVIGAGTMGGGIAMNFANAGLPVTIIETSQAALDRGLSIVRKNYDNSARRGKLSATDVERRMALIEGSLAMNDLADSDLVIEAVFEDMDLKKRVFAQLDGIVKQGAILATNTSYLDIDEIAAATTRPEFAIGTHFFSPANVMRLVELVRGAKTSKPVIATALQIAKKIGKIAALVGVCPGFVGNRMLGPRQREAQALVLEGAAIAAVDNVLFDFGFPMGPFAMGDLAGLDVGWKKETSKRESLKEIFCEAGRLGQKTKAGFYDYDESRAPGPSPAAEKLVAEFRAERGIAPRVISNEEILARCVFPMINEGAKILDEKIAIRASDIDIIWVNGYGWPVYRGGPMFYGDLIGLDIVLAKMKEWHATKGDAFKPSTLLEQLVADRRKFADLR